MKSSSRRQLRKGDRSWEGSLGETCEPTNRNCIRGRVNRASWLNTAKPMGLSSSGKCSGCARESHAPYRGRPIAGKLAVGFSRGHSSRNWKRAGGTYTARLNNETGLARCWQPFRNAARREWTQPTKDQTSQMNRPHYHPPQRTRPGDSQVGQGGEAEKASSWERGPR